MSGTSYHGDHDTLTSDPIVTHWISQDGQREIECGPARLSEARAMLIDAGAIPDAGWIVSGEFWAPSEVAQ